MSSRSGPIASLLLLSWVLAGCGGRVSEHHESTGEPQSGAAGEGSDPSAKPGEGGNTPAELGGREDVPAAGRPETRFEPLARSFVLCPGDHKVMVRVPACGDGILDSSEECDDGNAISKDGCSARCRVERGYGCLDPGKPCSRCGDCVVDEDEACDDGNQVSGDGCSERCQVEPGYLCLRGVACVSLGICGDGDLNPFGEVCDDGNTESGDGCSEDCSRLEPGYSCLSPGDACLDVSAKHPHCGDGTVQVDEGEECDDGINEGRLNGCSQDCQAPYCGDGQVQREWGEECDDGVNSGNYGACQPGCRLPFVGGCDDCSVHYAYCGDGVVELDYEACDEGAYNSVYGHCDLECELATGGYCGDGFVDNSSEECDDGNLESCDGCSALCQLEFEMAL